ncbi:MAG: hypothetical protein KJ906_03535 [Nanoarchaeota archaeon]|nr:hypothetical protein [Nanoarchaeota archaeon]
MAENIFEVALGLVGLMLVTISLPTMQTNLFSPTFWIGLGLIITSVHLSRK